MAVSYEKLRDVIGGMRVFDTHMDSIENSDYWLKGERYESWLKNGDRSEWRCHAGLARVLNSVWLVSAFDLQDEWDFARSSGKGSFEGTWHNTLILLERASGHIGFR